MSNRPSGPTSVDNALQLIRLLVEHRALRVSEAADLLGVAPSTAHRLLSALCQQGFAEQAGRGAPYLPGPVLREVGHGAAAGFDLRLALRPALEWLAEQTGETVSACVLEGHHVRFVDGIESHQIVRVADRVGVLMPAHATAAGKAMMAQLSDYELERRFAGRGLERRTGNTVQGWQELRRELANVRRAGFAMNVREGTHGVSAVGVAVTDTVGAPVASVNVALPSTRMPTKAVRRELVAQVREAADRASRAVRDWR